MSNQAVQRLQWTLCSAHCRESRGKKAGFASKKRLVIIGGQGGHSPSSQWQLQAGEESVFPSTLYKQRQGDHTQGIEHVPREPAAGEAGDGLPGRWAFLWKLIRGAALLGKAAKSRVKRDGQPE